MLLAHLSMTLSLLIVGQAPTTKAEWQPFSPPGKGFTVSMPGDPKHSSRDIPGREVREDSYEVILADRMYEVVVSEWQKAPDASKVASIMETSCRNMAARETNGKVTYLKVVKTDEVEGREVLYDYATPGEGKPFSGRARVFQAGSRFYFVMYCGNKGTAEHEEVQKFLESFKLTDAGAKAAAKEPKVEKGQPSGPVIAAKWQPFSTPDKSFTVSMPGVPKPEKQDLEDGSMKIDSYEVNLGDRSYLAACYELRNGVPAADQGKALEAMCTGMATESKGTIAESKAIKFDGLNGREVFIDYANPEKAKPDVGRARVFLVGLRAYMIYYRGEKGTADRNEVQKFFTSLRINKTPTPAKAKARL